MACVCVFVCVCACVRTRAYTHAHIGSQDELTALEQECGVLSIRASGLEKELAEERLVASSLRVEKELLLQHQKDLEESLQKAESLRQRNAEAESTCQKLREAKILKSAIKVNSTVDVLQH